VLALRLWSSRSERAAKSLFAFSVVYLFAIFAMLLADKMLVQA
jgi:heme O synthase-like polyprenyltransferase